MPSEKIKRCPLCNRTYADETISFCLADGALLSAPYDFGQATEQLPAARSTEPPLTEILPHAPVASTIASPFPPERLPASPAPEKRGRWPWMLGGFFILMAIGAIFIIGYYLGREKTGGSNDNSSVQNSPSNSNATVNSNNATLPQPATLESAIDDNRNAVPKPSSAASQPVDYGEIFRPDEVDEKVVILSKPTPGYTEAARQNQVTGRVTVKMVLTSAGTVTNISVVSGLPDGLSEKAIEAAREIKFKPATKDGRPVSQSFTVGYYFNLY